MNGDEDLGVDIKMKGEPFHFEQKAAQTEQKGDDWNANGEPEKVSILQTPIAKTHTTFYGEKDQATPQTEQKPEAHALFASGMNGDEDLGVDIKMKGEPYHFEQKPIDLKLFASGMNGDEDLGVDIKMKGEPFHFEQKAAQTEQKGDDWSANGEPEKVSILQTPIAKTHTTFYGEKPE